MYNKKFYDSKPLTSRSLSERHCKTSDFTKIVLDLRVVQPLRGGSLAPETSRGSPGGLGDS